jgi:putative hydrolase of the HAD superfamily
MSPARGAITAITFDFWDTLVRSDTPAFRLERRIAVAEVLARHGLPAEHDDIEAAFDHAWKRFDESWALNEQFTGHHAAEAMLEILGHKPDAVVRQQIIDAYLSAGRDIEIELAPNVADALRALKAGGLRLGIICDVGLTPSTTLRHILDRHGVLELFDHWSFSDDVGVYKPDPVIFEHALAGLGGVDPATTAHIGDLRRTDIAGARGMGILALRYSGVNDDDRSHGDEGDVVVEDHAHLPALLGVASPS